MSARSNKLVVAEAHSRLVNRSTMTFTWLLHEFLLDSALLKVTLVPLKKNNKKMCVGIQLALSSKGAVWCWGASPQQVRAAAARRAGDSPPPPPSPDKHLTPRRLFTSHVAGDIVQVLQLQLLWLRRKTVQGLFGTIFGSLTPCPLGVS